jgi:putative lipoprotein
LRASHKLEQRPLDRSPRLCGPIQTPRAAVVMLTAALTWTALSPGLAAAQDDPWFARDKAAHFFVSAVLAWGGYAAGIGLFECKRPRLVLGGGVALAAGISKEIWDASGDGRASWRDLVWDVLGTAAGLGLAWSIDGDPVRCGRATDAVGNGDLRAPGRPVPWGGSGSAGPGMPARIPLCRTHLRLAPSFQGTEPRVPRVSTLMWEVAANGPCP